MKTPGVRARKICTDPINFLPEITFDMTINSTNIKLIFKSMRPKQWVKNLLLFAGLIFSKNLYDPVLFSKTVIAFFLFCLLSGGTYLLNDITDKIFDEQNPLKNRRPIASGLLDARAALTSALLFFILSIIGSFSLDISFGRITILYLLTQLLYSFWLKKLIILDIFTVVCSHLLRVIAGTVLIGVEISSWLLACTLLLALFLVICKRRHELVSLGETVSSRRMTAEYSTALLDQMVSVVTAATLISYCLYTMSEKTIQMAGTENLIYTIPFVLYGIFRYLYLVYKKTEGGYPEETLLKDKPLLVNIILWIGTVVFLLYF